MGRTQAGPPQGLGGAGKRKKYRNLPVMRLVALFLIFSPAAVFASPSESSKASNPLAGQAPSSVLSLGDQKPTYALVVDKSQQKLFLYQQEEAGPKLIRTFNCATGENAGQKKTRGDKRTPEGVYFFTRWIEYKNLASIYGIRAFPMDYPNLFDRREDHRGDGIWLHGTDKPLSPTSTNGCIVLENEDVAEISKYIRLKQTPIIIRERIETVSLEEIQRERRRFLDFLKDWKQAWESKNLDRYMSLHSRKFHCRNLDWEGWKNYKARLNQQYKTIQVTIENPMILKHKENVLIVFYQRYQSDKFRNEGTKRLYLIPEEGDYKIIGEEWDERRGGEIPPAIPPGILASFATPKAPGPMAKAKPAQSQDKTEPPKVAASPTPAGPPPSKPGAAPAAEARREAIEKTPAVNLAEIKAFLNAWKSSWEKKDLHRYMDCYSKSFRSQGKNWDQWKQHKKSLNERYRLIQVTLEDIQAKRVGDQVVVTFRQTYRSDSLKSAGLKSLTLRQEGSSWKIFREDFARTKGSPRA
jgi:murein L,D-transpeptidase YafK